jgi:hypothetical protein
MAALIFLELGLVGCEKILRIYNDCKKISQVFLIENLGYFFENIDFMLQNTEGCSI